MSYIRLNLQKNIGGNGVSLPTVGNKIVPIIEDKLNIGRDKPTEKLVALPFSIIENKLTREEIHHANIFLAYHGLRFGLTEKDIELREDIENHYELMAPKGTVNPDKPLFYQLTLYDFNSSAAEVLEEINIITFLDLVTKTKDELLELLLKKISLKEAQKIIHIIELELRIRGLQLVGNDIEKLYQLCEVKPDMYTPSTNKKILDYYIKTTEKNIKDLIRKGNESKQTINNLQTYLREYQTKCNRHKRLAKKLKKAAKR